MVEELDTKAELLAELAAILGSEDAVLATHDLLALGRAAAQASGRPDRFLGLHVFNPVPRMKLVELASRRRPRRRPRERAPGLCAALGKTAVEVPDMPGFVVNRLLFPYLFDAVRLLEETGMEPGDVDTCMKLGAGHPMGPLALLDFVGLDVSEAIGETIGEADPARSASSWSPKARSAARADAGFTDVLLRRSRGSQAPSENLSHRLRRLLAGLHRAGDTGPATSESQRTPASSQCARSGPLPPRAGRV